MLPLVADGLARDDPVAPREAVAAILVRYAAPQGVPAPLQVGRDVVPDLALSTDLGGHVAAVEGAGDAVVQPP